MQTSPETCPEWLYIPPNGAGIGCTGYTLGIHCSVVMENHLCLPWLWALPGRTFLFPINTLASLLGISWFPSAETIFRSSFFNSWTYVGMLSESDFRFMMGTKKWILLHAMHECELQSKLLPVIGHSLEPCSVGSMAQAPPTMFADTLNTLRSRRDGWHLGNTISKCIFQ